jgi:hypothetical protein
MELKLRSYMTDLRYRAQDGPSASKNWQLILQRTLSACVSFILITGSISSTYGAEVTLCTAAAPTNAAEALAARPGNPDEPIHYREEVFHPALNRPISSRGWFEVRHDGSLVRHQTEPELEETRVGAHFIFIRRQDDQQGSNILPIPPDLAELLKTIRAIVGPTGPEALAPFVQPLELSSAGWILRLSRKQSNASDQNITLSGCGEVIRHIEFSFPSGERRVIAFEPTP